MEPLTVPGILNSLGEVRAYVRTAATMAGLDRKQSYRLQLAVDEIATNTIVHGYEEAGRAGNLGLCADITAEALTIVVEDSAEPFDPLAQPAPDDLDTPLEEREIGGLGVYLAKENVDEFRYECVNGRNRNIFVVLRPAPETAKKGSTEAPSG